MKRLSAPFDRIARRLRSLAGRLPMAHLLKLARNELARFVAAIFVLWLVGATVIHLAERGDKGSFATWGDSFFNVWVMLFSGVDTPPKTLIGRGVTVMILVAGVCLVGLFTGAVASVFVERRLRRREVSHFEMEDHLVLCNWSPRALEWIEEVHSKIIQDKHRSSSSTTTPRPSTCPTSRTTRPSTTSTSSRATRPTRSSYAGPGSTRPTRSSC